MRIKNWKSQNVSGNIRLYLRSNVKIKRIFYIGYCRRTVCAKGALVRDKGTNRGNIEIAANPRMAPHMKLLVFTVKEDGKILSTPVIVRFASVALDQFKVTWTSKSGSKKQAKQLSFSINSEKGAFVGLLGVDESIRLKASSDNDITRQKMERAMQSQEDSMALWSVYDSFGSVGVVLLTDGYLPNVGFVPHFSSRSLSDHEDDDEETVRQDFPETWIWDSLTAANGMGTIAKRVPDTMTTWVVTGFSVGEEHGLVILNEPLHLKVKKEVYTQLHVPAAIKRYQEIDALCLIHNNGNEVNVTVEGLPNLSRNPRLFLAKGATEKIPFKLVGKHVGVLKVKVVVRNINGNIVDAMQLPITVHPDGEVKMVEDVRLVNYQQNTSENISLTMSALEANPGCSDAEVVFSVVGTIVNLNQFDLERLIATSYGNGEDNLLFLQMAITVYEYLATTKDLSEGRKNQLVGYMEIAYQQHLRFRLDDGSFSMFGSMRKCGGTWLTAASVETLLKATAYLSVDSSIITDGLSWLAAQSQDDGSFKESCTIAQPHIQSNGVSLASSVMFAFIGNKFSHQYTDVINKTISMLAREQIKDVYVLAKTTFLLSMIQHQSWNNMWDQLNKLAKEKDVYRYWGVEEQVETPSAKTRNQGATAYALLVNLKKHTANMDQLLRVAQWIQQNSFANEQWTPSFEKVVALRALKALHDELPTVVPSMNVVVESHKLQVNGSNRELLQTVALENGFRNVEVSLTGTGLIMMKLSYRCTIPPTSEESTILSPKTNGLAAVNIKKRQHHQQLEWSICISYRVFQIRCDMAKFSIYLPTGLMLLEQPTMRHNQTTSVFSLEHNTRLELIYDIRKMPFFCYPVKARNYFHLERLQRGYLKICSMDAKDNCPVYTLY
uniref:Alpha-2-macroglobulin domain-containing protein n=1 Tax=Anopheles atroparvus TaxID=41427 RepID=A0A182JJQ7_ANOAO